MKDLPLLTREEIGRDILKGETLIIYNNHVLRIPQAWLDKHPGGSLSILHFVGRDATDEIDAYHDPATLNLIQKYAIGSVQNWRSFLPPIESGWLYRDSQWSNDARQFRPDSSQILLIERDPSIPDNLSPDVDAITPAPFSLSYEVHERHSLAYKRLHKRITDAGLYQCPYITGYGPEFIRYISLACISAYAYSHSWFLTSALFLGLMWHQLVFFVHDLGHTGVTHNWTIDRLVSIAIANFIGGLSVGWWVDNHNIHHLVTNHPSHDPDIEYLPFFAITPQFFNDLYSTYYKRTFQLDKLSKILIPIQHKLFYIVMLFARFNLYRLSYVHLYFKRFDTKRARGGRWAWYLEIIGIIFFWIWYTNLLLGCGSWKMILGYLLVSHAATSPLHVQIVLSHFSMSTKDYGPSESFASRQLRTTTDVICPPSIGFIHGGLHLQVAHHLFPRLPRHNLLKASLMVKEFAKEEGLTYAEFGFVGGNKEVLSTLKSVADQLKIMTHVATVESREAVEKKIRAKETKERAEMHVRVNGNAGH